MLTKAISSGLSRGEQISVSEGKTIAELGFESMICNPIGSEGADQSTVEEVRSTAGPGVEQAMPAE